ncbi:T9SS type A sorting domain-containing protein, partial [Acinetobacter baumannii]
NPSSGSFIINCEGDMIHDVYLSVYDILGQQVDFTSEMLNSELNSRSYAISITEPGTYILKVRSGTNTYYRKLIKQ